MRSEKVRVYDRVNLFKPRGKEGGKGGPINFIHVTSAQRDKVYPVKSGTQRRDRKGVRRDDGMSPTQRIIKITPREKRKRKRTVVISFGDIIVIHNGYSDTFKLVKRQHFISFPSR